jgi:hypothetical protein
MKSFHHQENSGKTHAMPRRYIPEEPLQKLKARTFKIYFIFILSNLINF